MTRPFTPYRTPISTYRLQFNHSFTFRDAATLIPYLHELGISDCYASPYLKAVPGSTHGYDIIDPTCLNPEIGSPEDYQTFIGALKQYDMGQILDIVPNHMGIAQGWNSWWQDVLENGPCSHYAHYFDIDWHPVKDELENKVLLPILGDQYGIVLEHQEITLCYNLGEFFLQYYEHRLPLDPTSWVLILNFRIQELLNHTDPADLDIQELQSINTALGNLPQRTEQDPSRIDERYREIEVIKRRMATLVHDSSGIAQFLQDNLEVLNGTKGVPSSFDILDTLISSQAYRLAYWRVAAEEINYRRFFDINQLAAIRIEDSQVFHTVHSFVLDLLGKHAITGLRIDHVDGLYDPRGYLTQWQQWVQKELGWSQDTQGRSLFLLVEKILGKGETLCEDWPIHGTSGYEFLALVNNVFVDTSHRRAFDDLYTKFIKDRISLEHLVYENKKIIMTSSMASEINALGHQLNILSEKNRRSRDFTLISLIHTIREIIACFPVYRTYVTPNPKEHVTDRDRAYIRLAVTMAKRKNPATNTLVFDFVRDLLLKGLDDSAQLHWQDVHPFVMKFQQTTSPVTAKGVEDTTFYIYNRLISLNEVGSEPSQFGVTLPAFHERMRERQERWPSSLSTTSTHDTKRSEDIRARINVLSEMPKEWKASSTRWHRLNKKKKRVIEEQAVPHKNEEYLLYQTLIGAWPLTPMNDEEYETFLDRIKAYITKALREAKIHTSWINPNEAYEQETRNFIQRILDRKKPNPFLEDFRRFQEKIAYWGMVNGLSQVAIKVLAPGIPDFYQGMEIWNFTLVDPDNRNRINYETHKAILGELKTHQLPLSPIELWPLLEQWQDSRIKLYVTMSLLNYRKHYPQLFEQGDYKPLEPFGEKSEHICGFQRQLGNHAIMVMVPRFPSKIFQFPPMKGEESVNWGQTSIPLTAPSSCQQWTNILTGEILMNHATDQGAALSAKDIFQHCPIAILEHIS
jgi:(1->4)-alpha-D-glucan 1-alpha-D-glucosylmutase